MKNTLLCVMAFPLSGCIALPIPHDRQLSPEFYGVVTDIESGAAISGVEMKVSIADPRGTGIKTSSVTTGVDGKYRVSFEERATWYILIAGPAEGSCYGNLSATHPGFEAQSISSSEFRGAAVDGVCSGYEVQRNIQLKRKAVALGAE